uniref:Uncharacterized protein n=1 Tax=Romanomermis culicivorax TaxID=13658 RepID=A0A915KI72_ROMCU
MLLPTATITSMLAPISTVSTTGSAAGLQPTLVIATASLLGATSPAGTVICSTPQLPSQAITLPNYTGFRTTDLLNTITLATPRFLPNINLNVEFFSLGTMQEMVLINFFGQLSIHVTI